MIKNPLIVGVGGIGGLVATLLNELGMDVAGIDQQHGANVPESMDFTVGDVTNPKILNAAIKGCDAVISCLPYNLTIEVAKAAHKAGVHYFDPTEDVATTQQIRDMAETGSASMMPQCGLAPGFIGIVGSALAKQFDDSSMRFIKLRVGALPQHPIGQLGYAGNWSLEGLVHECIAPCDAIIDGVRAKIPALKNTEIIRIKGIEYEAFTTSGGLGTMTETYEGKTEILNYKSIRYPGHYNCMKLLLEELRFKESPDELVKHLRYALPPDLNDRVLVHASVQGAVDGNLQTREFVADYLPIEIDGQQRTAIAWTTSCSIAAAIEMVSKGDLPAKGFIKQEDVPLDRFLNTQFGELFAKQAPEIWQLARE